MNQKHNTTIAGTMGVEDHLCKLLNKTGPKISKPSNVGLLPKEKHSAFGDFPKSHMPKKQGLVAQPAVTTSAEQSIAAGTTTMSKSFSAPLFKRLRFDL